VFYSYVEYLVEHNIFDGEICRSGYPKEMKCFNTNMDITRGDFTDFIVKTFGIEVPVVGYENFKDVNVSDKNYDSILTAKYKGLIHGYPDGNFYSGNKITRGEAMKILMKALELKGVLVMKDIEKLSGSSQFNDVPSNHEFYYYVLAAVKLGLIDGYGDGRFGPQNTITRGESSKVIVEGKGLIQN